MKRSKVVQFALRFPKGWSYTESVSAGQGRTMAVAWKFSC